MQNQTIKQFSKSNKVLKRCIIFFTLITAFSIQSCEKSEQIEESKLATSYEAKNVLTYFDNVCKIAKTTEGFFPPQVARAYGYIGIANYESVVHGIEGGVSLQNQLNGFSNYTLPKPEPGQLYNWGLTSNAATSQMIRYMFDKKLSSPNRQKIDSLESAINTQLSEYEDDIAIIERSISFGKAIADVIYEYSKTDGGHESYIEPFQIPFEIPTDRYCWVPTGNIVYPLSPKWGENRTFLSSNGDRVQPPSHMPFSEEPSSEFYQQAMSVYNQVKNNTSEEIEIAKYWADDPFATCTPTGHTFNILIQLLKEEKATLAKTSVALAKMSLAENDAFIACWKGKYKYILIRPVSYIQRNIDPNFNTVIGTPPFPAYTSGHSCEIGAGARILTNLFTNGSGDYLFTDYSQLQFGFFARSYSNFDEMAEECASSRFYGGIHYPIDNSKGLQVGKAIGDNVNKEIIWPLFLK